MCYIWNKIQQTMDCGLVKWKFKLSWSVEWVLFLMRNGFKIFGNWSNMVEIEKKNHTKFSDFDRNESFLLNCFDSFLCGENHIIYFDLLCAIFVVGFRAADYELWTNLLYNMGNITCGGEKVPSSILTQIKFCKFFLKWLFIILHYILVEVVVFLVLHVYIWWLL